MEEQVAKLAADMAALQSHDGVGNTVTAEFYYYLTIPLMILIHVGFLGYEMGASRMKNVLASGIKNILACAFMIPTFYYFGWWCYWAFPTGIDFAVGPNGISGLEYAAAVANPAGEAMGPHLGDNANGVFWGAFTLFACTTASIYSGAVIERIRLVPFVILAIILGSFAWVVAAAWGWHADGWLVTKWGFHDMGASGVVHTVAGFFALGVLIPLGARIGKFNADGTANHIAGHSMPMTMIGLMTIIVGFWGFLMACLIFPGEAWSWSTSEFTNIYGTPMTLSGLTFNILMAFAGGIIGAWMTTRDPFWMMSGALGGIISVASGLDLFWPPLTFCIAFVACAWVMPLSAKMIEKMGIDDAVGAVTVHGTLGIWGIMAVGVFATGYPSSAAEGAVLTSFSGQLVGAIVMALCGFVPGYLFAKLFSIMGILRTSEKVELAGMDPSKVPASAYPEGIPVSPAPAAE